MRRLILMRHAKAERAYGVADRDRPLDARGREAAPRMGVYLAAEELLPDAILVSSARRTVETWEGVRTALAGVEADLVPALYEAPVSVILDSVHAAPGDASCLLVIGHNPGIQDLAASLVQTGLEERIRVLSLEFPTAALAVIDFDIAEWSGVAAGRGHLERFVGPRDVFEAAPD